MLLDEKKIINAIYNARRKHRMGELEDNIKNVVHISFWETGEKSSDINKQKLIEMGKRGEPRPNQKKHPLGYVLNKYIQKGANQYDPIFDKKIRKIAPHWFAQQAETNKQKLIKMAREGESRPHRDKHTLGNVFHNYTQKGVSSYDPIFDKKIRKIAPHWFVHQAEINKQKLIEMGRSGELRPHAKKHPLGNVFHNYIQKGYGNYDPIFDKKIRKVAPHWFVKKADINKQKLIEMARKGEPKPVRSKHSLSANFKSYTCKYSNAYDPVFTKKIRKLAPHWFR